MRQRSVHPRNAATRAFANPTNGARGVFVPRLRPRARRVVLLGAHAAAERRRPPVATVRSPRTPARSAFVSEDLLRALRTKSQGSLRKRAFEFTEEDVRVLAALQTVDATAVAKIDEFYYRPADHETLWTSEDGGPLVVPAGDRRCVLVSTSATTPAAPMYASLRPCNARASRTASCARRRRWS